MRSHLAGLSRFSPPGAGSWYRGGLFGSVYVGVGIWEVWTSDTPVGTAVIATLLLLVVGAVFVVLPPAVWGRPRRVVIPAMLAYAALTCVFFPLIGSSTVWLFIYVACAVATTAARPVEAVAGVVIVALGQLAITVATDSFALNGFVILLTVSVSLMVLGIAETSRANLRLREAQSEVARLAVAEERARFSRDMHDVLGHSLTVVTVKSELAVRLVDRDPAGAKAEIADIERLSRSALADLRAAVAGYRQMNLDTELAAARAALAAAEIRATVPVSGTSVSDAALRELFAWSVRESVTNVIRHASASTCAIELAADAVRVCDDGVGMPVPASTAGGDTDAARGRSLGNGLAGLAERAAAAGATLSVEAREPRGTVVTVRAGIR